MIMFIKGYELICTCMACPEQYDVLYMGEEVGYLRLRHGWFRADWTYNGADETVYSVDLEDSDGVFTEGDRKIHLVAAIDALEEKRLCL